MDLGAIFGTVLAIAFLIIGQLMGGGQLGQMLQLSSALIVIGGTTAALLVSFPLVDLVEALRKLPTVYRSAPSDVRPMIAQLVEMAMVARKEGLLAMDATKVGESPLLKKGLKLIMDGLEPPMVKEILESELKLERERRDRAAVIFEAAASLAPAIGIIGAVLGMVQVMSALDDVSRLGSGVAIALISAFYGFVLANFLFVPWAAKLRIRAAEQDRVSEIIKQGIEGIQEGLNPHFLQEKLEVFLNGGSKA